jgi:rod shape determining protein RodA
MSVSRSRVRPAGASGYGLRTVDSVLLFSSLALTVFGIVGVYVAGSGDGQYYALNQVLGFFVGLAGAIPLALMDYRVLQRFVRPIFIAVIVMLLAVPMIGVVGGGARSWIDIGPVNVQPSEFAKPLMVVVLAAYISENRISDNPTFLKALGLISVPAVLVFLQPDLGTALVFGAIFFAMAFIGGAKLWQLGALLGAGGLLCLLAVKLRILHDYQVARLTAFLDPEGAGDVGYQVTQSKLSIGSGGFTGKGFEGETLATLGFLPEDHTDFIFSNLAERIGFVGSILLLILFFVLVWRILRIATVARDRFGVLLAVGVATIFLFHIFVNIGMAMGMMPVTGLPLPFVSYGRSSLVTSVVSLGLLHSIAARSRAER